MRVGAGAGAVGSVAFLSLSPLLSPSLAFTLSHGLSLTLTHSVAHTQALSHTSVAARVFLSHSPLLVRSSLFTRSYSAAVAVLSAWCASCFSVFFCYSCPSRRGLCWGVSWFLSTVLELKQQKLLHFLILSSLSLSRRSP